MSGQKLGSVRLEIDYHDEAGVARTRVIPDIDPELVYDVCRVFAKTDAHADYPIKGWRTDPVVFDRIEKVYEREGYLR